ncbi:MAG: hypothetical protein Q4D76_14375 [Oscillospiraceae bacterium]|nr:hypothetical protein [Oscillospiraceae bacterium]
MQELKKEFIKLLKSNDKEIIKEIIRIVSENKEFYEKRMPTKRKIIAKRKKQKPETHESLILSDELGKYKEIDKIYSDFCSLDRQILLSLSNTIDITDVNTFIVSSSQLENIKTLWEYIKQQLDNADLHDISILKNTFDYFFSTYNRYKKVYSMLEVKPGDEYDYDIHSKGSNSNSSGIISEVLLQGYKNDITGKIEAKSVVRV